ncbi:MAG: hypothetical protein IH621_03730, partial [Krumholzibacteria bacterium]|nr:hypothetical protein [Candidatus Krumholzibacteria bacterium]
MRFVPESSSLGRWLCLPVAVLGAAGLVVAHRAAGFVDLLPPCRLRALTGLACPTCGGTGAAAG